MPKTIQIRNVPDIVYRKLKARATKNRMSLSAHLLSELREISVLPSLQEWQKRLKHSQPVELPVSAAEIVRAERDARTRHLMSVTKLRT